MTKLFSDTFPYSIGTLYKILFHGTVNFLNYLSNYESADIFSYVYQNLSEKLSTSKSS